MAAFALTSLECALALRRLGFRVTTTTASRVILQDPKRGRILTIPRHRIVTESELVLILLAAAVPMDDFMKNVSRGSGEMLRVETPDAITSIRPILAKKAG